MWNRLSSKVLLDHPRLKVEEDKVELPNGEVIDYLRYGYGGNGTVIIAQNTNNEILFIKEYSFVPNEYLFQFPMGKIEVGETIVNAGNRELQEETGFKANSITLKGSYYQNHRRSTNKGFVVHATDLEISELESDKEETGIEIIWVAIDKIASLIKSGEITDADTLSSLAISDILV
ncbi:MAG: NUDIX hydrolase [Candidatus Saccharibacteria bacterium]